MQLLYIIERISERLFRQINCQVSFGGAQKKNFNIKTPREDAKITEKRDIFKE